MPVAAAHLSRDRSSTLFLFDLLPRAASVNAAHLLPRAAVALLLFFLALLPSHCVSSSSRCRRCREHCSSLLRRVAAAAASTVPLFFLALPPLPRALFLSCRCEHCSSLLPHAQLA
ncbi:hypothetical protein VNO78_08032 [Psophocarpus tetragonolobus]|uniref:Uncharacterized protein n=1 Tax=Psophocarpus tetragonolobus TaxID=3891 RepID=A0AAN9SUA0_PSOTE